MAESSKGQLGGVLPRFPELDTQPFWDATRQHELRYQQCDRCKGVVFYPRRHCVHCTSTSLTWRTSAGLGKVYTYTVVRRSRHPAFKDLVPYWLAWVDLDEGFRMLTHVVGVSDADIPLALGQRVKLEWIDREEVSFPVFRPLW